MKVLISCVGSKVSLVKAFQESGWYVIGIDASPHSAAQFFADEFHIAPPLKKENEFISFIHAHPVDLIVPTSDAELPFWAINRDKFKRHVMIASYLTILSVQQKGAFCQAAQRLGFKVPHIVEDSENRALPLFLRATSNTGGSETAHVIEDRNDLLYWSKKYKGKFILQDHLGFLDEYTIDLFRIPSMGTVALPRKRVQIVNGESWVGVVDLSKQIIEESKILAEAFDLVGHNTLQCFFDGSNVYWIEVNPRFGGGYPLAHKAGLNSPEIVRQQINGEIIDFDKIQNTLQNGLTMYRHTENYFD